MENPAFLSDLRVNGQPVDMAGDGWWLDRQFRKIEITQQARAGRNEITVRVRWEKPVIPGTKRFVPNGTELDNFYLVGDFTVTGINGKIPCLEAGVIPDDPAADLFRQGLPFYTGTIRYETGVTVAEKNPEHRYILRFRKPAGEGLCLSINGTFVRNVWCPPYEVDCTAQIRQGDNRIGVDLFSNMANVMGPFHHGNTPWCDSGHAVAYYVHRPLGLNGAPEFVVQSGIVKKNR